MAYDVAIIGAGPAGIQAAILLAAEGKKVVLLERDRFIGGQIGHSALVENTFGAGNGLSGEQYRMKSLEQVSKFRVHLLTGYPVVQLEQVEPYSGLPMFLLNDHLFARVVVLALGLSPRAPAGFEVLPDCSVRMVSRLIESVAPNEAVLVVGGGNAAAQAALHYVGKGGRVTLLAKAPLAESMDGYYVRQLLSRVTVVTGDTLGVAGLHGNAQVAIRTETGCYSDIFAHVHFLIGAIPDTDWLPRRVQRDEGDFILTDRARMTALPGLFAIGDCVSGSVRRVSCALGAAGEVVHYINTYQRQPSVL